MTEVLKKKKKGRSGKETEHLKWFRLSCEEFGVFAHKIADLPFKFQSPKPFDMFLSAMGVPIAVEGKFSSETCSFGWSDLSENQRRNLMKFCQPGARGVAMAVLFVYDPANKLPPVMYYFNLEKYFLDWASGKRVSKIELAALPTKIYAVPHRVQKISAKGIKRQEKHWRYPVWPFLRACVDQHARNLRVQISSGSGASTVFRDLYEFLGRPGEVPRPPTV